MKLIVLPNLLPAGTDALNAISEALLTIQLIGKEEGTAAAAQTDTGSDAPGPSSARPRAEEESKSQPFPSRNLRPPRCRAYRSDEAQQSHDLPLFPLP